MRAIKFLLAGVVVLAPLGVAANACPYGKVQRIGTYAPSDTGGETIRKVSRGARLAIACDGVDLSSINDVRVVLNFSQDGAKKLGYQGVLATDQTRSDGRLQIRVPDAPDLANHTMNVKVFVMNGDNAKMCDAGRVRVV